MNEMFLEGTGNLILDRKQGIKLYSCFKRLWIGCKEAMKTRHFFFFQWTNFPNYIEKGILDMV